MTDEIGDVIRSKCRYYYYINQGVIKNIKMKVFVLLSYNRILNDSMKRVTEIIFINYYDNKSAIKKV